MEVEIKVHNLTVLADQLESSLQAIAQNVDAFFLIANAMIIYLMQCGFGFLECGAVRAKNATNILMKNILDSFIGALSYYFVGYAFAFGEGNSFIGNIHWALNDVPLQDFSLWFFHFVFAATAATIVSGSVAERCEFIAYVVYSVGITGFMYPVITHWAWSDRGWLGAGIAFEHNNETLYTSYQDFAGSGVVHLHGGIAALVGAIFLGPRIGRFHPIDKEPMPIPGHSVPLASLGGFILFFGFFAFNSGSQASISAEGDNEVIALAAANTILSGGTAAMTVLITLYLYDHFRGEDSKWSLLNTINGALSGMVAICAGCNVFYPWVALVVGMVAGLGYLLWSKIVLKLKIDDPLDAVAVHGASGFWGVMAVPIFAKGHGLIYDFGKPGLMGLAWNLVGALAIAGWTGALSIILFGSLKLLKLLRISENIEKRGLDVPKHGEPAYPIDAYGDGWQKHGGIATARKYSLAPDEFIKQFGDNAARLAEINEKFYAENDEIELVEVMEESAPNLPWQDRDVTAEDYDDDDTEALPNGGIPVVFTQDIDDEEQDENQNIPKSKEAAPDKKLEVPARKMIGFTLTDEDGTPRASPKVSPMLVRKRGSPKGSPAGSLRRYRTSSEGDKAYQRYRTSSEGEKGKKIGFSAETEEIPKVFIPRKISAEEQHHKAPAKSAFKHKEGKAGHEEDHSHVEETRKAIQDEEALIDVDSLGNIKKAANGVGHVGYDNPSITIADENYPRDSIRL